MRKIVVIAASLVVAAPFAGAQVPWADEHAGGDHGAGEAGPVPIPAVAWADSALRSSIWMVEPGDNLWKIAATVTGDTDVAGYWLELIAHNRDSLRSGDPDLIYPGEVISLP